MVPWLTNWPAYTCSVIPDTSCVPTTSYVKPPSSNTREQTGDARQRSYTLHEPSPARHHGNIFTRGKGRTQPLALWHGGRRGHITSFIAFHTLGIDRHYGDIFTCGEGRTQPLSFHLTFFIATHTVHDISFHRRTHLPAYCTHHHSTPLIPPHPSCVKNSFTRLFILQLTPSHSNPFHHTVFPHGGGPLTWPPCHSILAYRIMHSKTIIRHVHHLVSLLRIAQ